ncbi:hypothetical protein AWC38_SpisGene19146 [Stylophora pistillata]|uniref:Uncharacterized protein n=1 Tax=Stylophora pistillata TaxID=50429 RepID=A0A2B4RJN8_STYPI|nr:hypothetical protein AWC38_SpisGene19146 [Stylophora pistillata]
MDQVRFDYSTKNIPIPPRNSYWKRLIEKIGSVIKRMRWKAFFFDRHEQSNNDAANSDNFGFKSRKCPPQNSDLDKFEADRLDMVHNTKFRNVNNKFQNKRNGDIKKIKKSTKAFIPADKTSNFYKLDKTHHDKLLRDSITTTYKKASTDAAIIIDSQAKSISQELKIDDRAEQIAKLQAFITLKDHKDNFAHHPTCRLINPAKSELGKVSKQILDNINSKIRKTTKLNQWKNTSNLRRSGSLRAYRTFPPEQPRRKIRKNNLGLYRDDGLVLLRNTSGPQPERIREDITREFKKQGLNIYISTNLKICNFLDVTLNLADGSHYPYRKPNNETLYINTNSKHPPTIIKHIPAAIGRRISDISSSKELFNKNKPHYESALKQSGHGEKLTYTERKKPETHIRKSRQRNIIWFNPPHSMNVQTNIGRIFMNLVSKYFPKNHR